MGKWEKTLLGDVCQINPSLDTVLSNDVYYSVIPMDAVSTNGDILYKRKARRDEISAGLTQFRNGDILFAKITPCMENGKCTIASDLENGVGFGSTEFHVLRPCNKVEKRWLFHLVHSSEFRADAQRNMTGSAGQKRVPTSYLRKYEILLPPLPIQQKIADALDKASALIEMRKAQIEKLDLLIKSQFIEMFGSIHNSREYPYAPLKDKSVVVSGGTPDRDVEKFWRDGTIPWVKTGELQNCEITDVQEYITLDGLNSSAAKVIPPDTILVAMYGQGKTRGMTAYLRIEGCTNQACACILPSEKINQRYLWHYFILSYDKLREMAKGGNQPNLNLAIIKNFEVLTPPISLQNKFSAFVQKVDNQKTILQQSISRLELNYKSLVQKSFSEEMY